MKQAKEPDMTIDNHEFAQYTGRHHTEVVPELEERYPEFRIQVLASGGMATSDIRQDRIRVFFDKDTELVTRCVRR
jgi:hypothetical protein